MPNGSNEEKIILVGHDWGAYLAQFFKARHSPLVVRAVVLDVSWFEDTHFPKTRVMTHLVANGIVYQYVLVLGHLLSQVGLSNLADWCISKHIKVLARRYIDAPDLTLEENLSAKTGYLYLNYQKDVFLRIINVKGSGFEFLKLSTKEILDKLNQDTLYVFGARKPGQAHSEHFILQLNSDESGMEKSCAVALDTGHWISLEKPQVLNELILEYLEQPKEAATKYKALKAKVKQ